MSKNAAVGGLLVLVIAGFSWLGWQFLMGAGPEPASGSGVTAGSDRADPDEDPERASARKPEVAASRSEVELPEGSVAALGGTPREAVAMAAFLAGVVTDENGLPVAGATVSFGSEAMPGLAFLGMSAPARPGRKATETTDASGRFRLNGVPRSDNAVLTVEHPDHQTLRRSGLNLPSTGLDVGALVMQKGAALLGRVTGPGGTPVEGATVTFHPDMQAVLERNLRAPAGGGGGARTVDTKTDADGVFRLGGLSDLPGVVEASKRGLDRAETELMTPEIGIETGGLVLSLGTGLSIRGVVRDARGNPVPGAVVTWDAGNNGGFRMVIPSPDQDAAEQVFTDVDGRFFLEGLEHGTYALTAKAAGFAERTVDGVLAGERDPLVLVLKPGGEILCRILDANSGLPIEHARVRAQDAQGGMPWMGSPGPAVTAPEADMPQGTYLVQGLEAGQYTLQAEAEGYVAGGTEAVDVGPERRADAGVLSLVPAASIAGRVWAAPGDVPVEGARVTARRQGTGDDGAMYQIAGQRAVSVRMASPAGGGAIIDHLGGDAGSRVITDEEGRFTLQNLRPGTYDLLVEHPDHAPQDSDEITLESGQQHQGVEVALAQGGTLEGISLDGTGMPRPGDTITVKCGTPKGAVLRGTSDANGFYRIEHVPAGDHVARRDGAGSEFGLGMVVVMSSQPGKEEGRPFTMEEGDTVRVDFMDGQAGSLYGSVTSAAGPALGAEVRLHPRTEDGAPRFFLQPLASARVDATGRYELGPVAAGDYTVEVKHPKALIPVRVPVTLAAGSPQREDFFLEGAVVEGRVFGPGGRPLAGATVRLEEIKEQDAATQSTVAFSMVMVGRAGGGRRGGGFLQTTITGDVMRTEEDGSYRIEWVPDGRFQLKVDHPEYLPGESEILEIKNQKGTRNLDVTLEEGGTLVVQTTLQDSGRPAPERPVQIQKEEGGGHQIQMTDEQGMVTFTGLTPGTWTLSAPSFGDQPTSGPQKVQVFAGQESRATVVY